MPPITVVHQDRCNSAVWPGLGFSGSTEQIPCARKASPGILSLFVLSSFHPFLYPQTPLLVNLEFEGRPNYSREATHQDQNINHSRSTLAVSAVVIAAE